MDPRRWGRGVFEAMRGTSQPGVPARAGGFRGQMDAGFVRHVHIEKQSVFQHRRVLTGAVAGP